MMTSEVSLSMNNGVCKGKYTSEEIDTFAKTALQDGFVVLKNHFDKQKLATWQKLFMPLLNEHIQSKGQHGARGPGRYYVTLPFATPFADPAIFEDDDILRIVEKLVGEDFVMCQLATDTPLKGSEYQEVHRDTAQLFPEMNHETPMFQLAVNFPLVDMTLDNGPVEIARGTHMSFKEQGMEKIASGETKLEPVLMNVGDVMIRDVRGLHRGTPNKTDEPRPMVVIGYSRKWLFRPEVDVKVPRNVWNGLSDRAKHLLRFMPKVDDLEYSPTKETYDAFAH